MIARAIRAALQNRMPQKTPHEEYIVFKAYKNPGH
jgi:hypothetical protein